MNGFNAGGKSYEIPASAEVRNLDVMMGEVNKVVGLLEHRLDRIERLKAHGAASDPELGGTAEVLGGLLIEAASLSAQAAAHVEECAAKCRPLVDDNKELREQVQASVLERFLTLSERYDTAHQRLKVLTGADS